jgi:carbon-monoxide dehydrogenase medium subunit
MKPAPFGYQRARSIDDAFAALSAAGDDDVRVVAGGQSLGPMLNLRMVRPTLLVDIHRIDALRTVCVASDGSIRIGACVTHAELEDAAADGPLSGPGGDFIRHVAGGIAYRAIRTRGTIGGSLAHADPAADWPCALAALGATIELAGAGGTRRVPAASFGRGLFETALEPGEIIVWVELPAAPVSAWGYRKHCRKTGEFPHALAACVDRPSAGGQPDGRIQVWLGATGGAPVAITLERSKVAGLPEPAAERRSALRSMVAALLPEAIDRGDAYARHLHAQIAAEAIIDVFNNPVPGMPA